MPDSKVSVREASEADLAWCLSTDGHLDEAALLSKIRAREILLADSDGEPVGLLRFDLMWSSVPFIAQGFWRRTGARELGRRFYEQLRREQ
jgi:hypothetical protein